MEKKEEKRKKEKRRKKEKKSARVGRGRCHASSRIKLE